ncbi:DUF1800 domain-containing protein [Massilia sp. PAMC28688]|uniref:DUF1800 domain-containing protein n=1 Tax=Massilia sp. PAMC28688 TaxID=2861283 RepID=UPI001C62EE45|nr:DUF1800 domain-containing protein [Massilia sp. PAMC28688]QYF95820.1 DUF1800 domain-containing protein [Massilia sp. PAMC28688]
MPDSHEDCLVDKDLDADAGYTLERDWPHRAVPTTVLLSGALLSACGGGGGGAGAGTGPGTPPPPPAPAPPSAIQASRFLSQASMGATTEQIARVQSVGYAGWLDEQFAMPASGTRWEWLIANGFGAIEFKNGEAGADACQWVKLLSAPDTLRQRVTLALSEILVVAIAGLTGSGWKSFSAAAYLDLLEAHAFGNYRTLLQQVSLSAPMGEFLTYRNNVKFNANTGAMPDENYAREIMQLFTIGLTQLNIDGSAKLTTGLPTETYTLEDITGLARVFTGWNYDLAGGNTETPDFKKRPMIQNAARHESGAKTFIGTTIAAATDGINSLTLALDAIFAHANVAPFISRQLIQRLVCSNPSGAYIARVAAVFNNDGSGVKGNLKAVIKAILLDTEARSDSKLSDASFGKLREPILRFAAWARAFKATSPSGAWAIGNTSEPGTRLGQSPLRSGSVFNFFRPGYVPPNSAIGAAGMVAPEFQITNESTVVGYVNYMQTVISRGVGDVKGDYSALMPLAETSQALLDQINLVMAAGQLSTATLALIKGGIDSMPVGTDAARLNRIYAALVMVMAAPEFIVQK